MDPVLDRAEEGGGGLKCKGPTEAGEEGPEEWVVTYGQWVIEVCLEYLGVWRVTPSSGWDPWERGRRHRAGTSTCVVHGERKLQNLSFLCFD